MPNPGGVNSGLPPAPIQYIKMKYWVFASYEKSYGHRGRSRLNFVGLRSAEMNQPAP
jgi:hypothetical protein